MRVTSKGQQILVNSELQEDYNTVNQRGELTFKTAIHEMLDGVTPDLKCHFSGDYSENPWWKINFDQPYAVKTVKIFNL